MTRVAKYIVTTLIDNSSPYAHTHAIRTCYVNEKETCPKMATDTMSVKRNDNNFDPDYSSEVHA